MAINTLEKDEECPVCLDTMILEKCSRYECQLCCPISTQEIIQKQASHASISFATPVYLGYARSIGAYDRPIQKQSKARRSQSVLNVASKPHEQRFS
jgi:hypothetical protein